MTEQESIFTKIINREADSTIVYEDDDMIAIEDINPKAPVHILLIPKEPVPDLNHFEEKHTELLGKMMLRIPQIAKEKGIAESGYKVVNNVGDDGGQIVAHFHLHILGGEPIKTLV